MFRDKCYEFGKILKPHGVKGEFVIKSNSSIPESFELTESLFLEIEGILVPFFIEEYTISSAQTIIVKLEEISNKDKLMEFVDCNVYLEGNEKKRAKADLKNVEQIIGFTIYDQNETEFGKVVGYEDIPGNLLLIINHNKKEVLVPFNEYLLISIDKRKRRIILEIDPGLVDLN